MNWAPMRHATWWVLLHPDGRWWCEKPITSEDLARRTADEWNRSAWTTPTGQIGSMPPSEQVRVAKVVMREQSASLQLGDRVRLTYYEGIPPLHVDGTVQSVDVTEAEVLFDDHTEAVTVLVSHLVRLSQMQEQP